MADLDFEEDVSIDPEALDVMWLDQPMLFMRYAQAAAKANEKLARAKENRDVVRAELDSKIRKAPEKYFGEDTKVTNPAVEAAILQHDDYKEANDGYMQAQYDFDMAQAAVRAMDHKKTALENLVRLHAASYFAGPSVPREIGEEFRKHASKRGREEAREKTAHATRGSRRGV